MRLFLSHRIITTFASGNSVVSFRYSFSPRNLLLQVAFIERESQYGSCSLSKFVERGGRRKMFERFNAVPIRTSFAGAKLAVSGVFTVQLLRILCVKQFVIGRYNSFSVLQKKSSEGITFLPQNSVSVFKYLP